MPALEIVKVSETSKCVSHLSPTPVRVPSPSSVSVDMYARRHCTLPLVSVNYGHGRLHNSPIAETKKTNEKHITKYTIDHTQERKRESEGGREPGKVRRGVISVRHSKSKFDCSDTTIPDVASTCHNIGLVLIQQGNVEKAKDKFEEAADIRRAKLGARHALTKKSERLAANCL